MTGDDANAVDHINGEPSDNRWCNLRNVSLSENLKNARLPKHNKSGVVGVQWDSRRRKWVAQIKSESVNHVLGRFNSFEAAAAARKQAERELGFHENHGRSQ